MHFQSLFQVCFNMFYKLDASFSDVSETAIKIATRDLTQLPLLPTKVMCCGLDMFGTRETQGSQGLYCCQFGRNMFIFSNIFFFQGSTLVSCGY